MHQIQSGQVIVDLCSVVKELVENSLDAGASSIEVRFKGYGLDAIEVQDNGNGVAPEDYETIALKHYTSKLSSYDDLTALQTFGFRGEALSSLCALSNFYITTARAQEAPRGTKLEFEHSGKLRSRSVIASQRGTTVSVEEIFRNLPVRRKELDKNIKREYGKALGLLHAYACISTNVRFSVSNQAGKGGKTVAFSTKSNPTTKENISNVYGAKTVLALLELDLQFEMESSPSMIGQTRHEPLSRDVTVQGYISRPVVGGGRQAPDRQMFFVNSRPCSLPQVSKAVNEIYKSFNVTQSPFIFANLLLDTNAYDVNVSPDKRVILLHDESALLESIKTALTDLFDKHDQTVPSATIPSKSMPSYRSVEIGRPQVSQIDTAPTTVDDTRDTVPQPSMATSPARDDSSLSSVTPPHPISDFAERNVVERDRLPLQTRKVDQLPLCSINNAVPMAPSDELSKPLPVASVPINQVEGAQSSAAEQPPGFQHDNARAVNEPEDNDHRLDQADPTASRKSPVDEPPIPSSQSGSQKYPSGPLANAFARMRPTRLPEEVVTVTVGDKTTYMTLGSASKRRKIHTPAFGSTSLSKTAKQFFGKGLQSFAAPGTQAEISGAESDGSEDDEASEEDDPSFVTGASEQSVGTTARDTRAEDGDGPSDAGSPLFVQDDPNSDEGYIDEEEKKRREEARVAKMIADAEEAAAIPSEVNVKRAAKVLRARTRKESTLQLVHNLEHSVSAIEAGLDKLHAGLQRHATAASPLHGETDLETTAKTAEERLSLTVSKSDFKRMRIVGQFNLGFIIAVRPASSQNGRDSDELFIIDQHAADEKYNFERLSANTIVQNQRLVHPKPLELTAVEEEIILEQSDVLTQNGFRIDTDESGATPVGRRCKLVGLPMSKEVTFTIRDLEELIALLGDSSTDTTMATDTVVRPSKVRRMLAMRACRSSIMVGRSLSGGQMARVVRHMGEMDKPWNCPHGRPTMRHLFGMDGWQEGWLEGKGILGLGEDETSTDWKEYLRATTP